MTNPIQLGITSFANEEADELRIAVVCEGKARFHSLLCLGSEENLTSAVAELIASGEFSGFQNGGPVSTVSFIENTIVEEGTDGAKEVSCLSSLFDPFMGADDLVVRAKAAMKKLAGVGITHDQDLGFSPRRTLTPCHIEEPREPVLQPNSLEVVE